MDRAPRPGSFVLTGSHQPALHEAVSQSLAGRTAVLTLLPFSLDELRKYGRPWDAFDILVHGTFPRLHDQALEPRRFFSAYLRTYVERDVRALINLKDLNRFQQFLTLLAGRVGQVANYTALASDVGVSSTTIRQWISVLEASYVLFALPPYFENLRKRVIKSPKIYFTDVGLATYLLGIADRAQVARDPLRGGLYENFFIVEILKAHLNKGLRPEMYFYRDTHGNEVDLVVRRGGRLVPVEIKSASTFTGEFLSGLGRFRAVVGEQRSDAGFVLYNGEETMTVKGVRILNPLRHRGIERVAIG
jgi:predicted AAA+ superfamily ATPase